MKFAIVLAAVAIFSAPAMAQQVDRPIVVKTGIDVAGPMCLLEDVEKQVTFVVACDDLRLIDASLRNEGTPQGNSPWSLSSHGE